MEVIIGPLLRIILTVIELYVWIVVIGVAMSWLISFNVVNASNRFVGMISEFVFKVTEPALRPIRNLLPVLGGFDLSPVALILLLILIQDVVIQLLVKLDY